MHKFSTAATKSSALPALHDPRAGAPGLLSALFHRYGGVRGERDGVEFAKRRRRDVCVHRGGGGTKKLMPSRRHPSGWWGLRATSVSLVVADVPASPSPCSLISPRKPHQRTSPYLSSEALNVLVGVSRWLTRTACVAHLYQCGFGFAIRTVRASHRLAPTSLRDKNLCIIRAMTSRLRAFVMS